MEIDSSLKKFRDRLRIIILLYTFCERLENKSSRNYGVFRGEIKIQALDFLLRYPDFLSMELMALLDEDKTLDADNIKAIIIDIYGNKEPEIRVEEMEKFFHGAYESIDEVIAFYVSIGFLEHESKKRIDGKTYDKQYFITQDCVDRIEQHLQKIEAVSWFFDRCKLLKKYFDAFSGTELKARQYKYAEYSGISYRSHIKSINEKVRSKFVQRFNHVI